MNSSARWYKSARKTFRARARGAGPAQGGTAPRSRPRANRYRATVLWKDNSAADSLVRNSRRPTPTHVALTYRHTRLKISSVPWALCRLDDAVRSSGDRVSARKLGLGGPTCGSVRGEPFGGCQAGVLTASEDV